MISRAAADRPANAARVRKHLPGALATKPVAFAEHARPAAAGAMGWSPRACRRATINRTRAGLRAALELAAILDHRIANSVFRLALKGLPGGQETPAASLLPDADVLRIVKAAYEEDRAFGLLIEVRWRRRAHAISQVARLPMCRPASRPSRSAAAGADVLQRPRRKRAPAGAGADHADGLAALAAEWPRAIGLTTRRCWPKSDGTARGKRTNRSEHWGHL